MKRNLILLVAAFAVLCGCTKETKEEEKAAAPQFVSVSPASGTTDVAIDKSLEIVFTYDQNIKAALSYDGKVTLSPSAKVEKTNAYGKDLTVTVSGLEYETEYTLTIAEGYVQGYKDNQDATASTSMKFTTVAAPAPPKTVPEAGTGSGGWENNTAAVLNMKTGWNLGNTLESGNFNYDASLTWTEMLQKSWIYGNRSKGTSAWETAWGQPVATRELIHMFKTAGFGVIRVPVTWAEHMDTDGKIDEAWMSRVEEVVGYVLDEGLYCILNVHHDTGTTGWLRADASMYDKYKDQYAKLWTNIATRFKDKGDHLLFESYNEMLNMNAAWSVNAGDAALPVINKFAQLFVTTVRATGGNNAHRNIIVNTYAGSSDSAIMEALEIPEDSATDHLIAEVHSYAPYRFAFKQDDAAQQITEFNSSCESEVKNIVKTVAEKLHAKGVACIIGEYGADSATANDTELGKQAACYVSTAKQYGICCIYWMGLSDGSDRSVPKWTKPIVKDAILNAWNN